MRINVYSQELTDEVEFVSTQGFNIDGEEEVFLGVRIYLHSPDQLHHTTEDDDRSAVTFWAPKSEQRRHEIAEAFRRMATVFDEVGDRLFEPGGGSNGSQG